MFGKTQVAPSILSADFMALGRDVETVARGGADWIHVDVMDGHFVPNLTIGPAHVSALKRLVQVPLDVHLMVDNPLVQAPWYLEAGADSVTVHREAADDDTAAEVAALAHGAGARAGIAVNPETDVEALRSIVGLFDLVLVMSVHPGFGGQAFIEATPGRVAQAAQICSAAGCSPVIEVDGGIDERTAPLVAARGADLLVAGSAVFMAKDPVKAMEAIRDAGRS